MGGLNLYIVSYDISDSKRLRQVHRALEGFSTSIHYSVFRCDLSPKGLVELKSKLSELINHREGRVMIIDLGLARGSIGKRITFMGRPPEEEESGDAIVI